MAAPQLVRSKTADGIVTVILDSQHNRNALSRQLVDELRDAVASAADASPRALVLTHVGPAFCAGADLHEARAASREGRPPDSSPMLDVVRLLMDVPFPTIASVTGAIRAGGIGLLAACDLSVVADDVSFALTEVRIGVAPAIISVPILRRVSPAKIAAAMLTGESFSADVAASIGLVSHAVPAAQVEATVASLCGGIRAGAPGAVAATKDLLWRIPGVERDAGLAEMADLSAALFGSDEAAEGIAAFTEKRPPTWSS